MADVVKVVPVWCDVGKNLSSVYLVLCLKSYFEYEGALQDKVKSILKINPRQLICEGYSECGLVDTQRIIFPVEFSPLPKSCSSLEMFGGSELRMRISMATQMEGAQEELSRMQLKKELNYLRAGPHSICCKMCGIPVLKPKINFKRVLELPSENWLELCQDWCCHGSEHLTSLTGRFQPKAGDCLLGHHYIMLHPSDLELTNMHLSLGMEQNFVKCSRCNVTLGDVSADNSDGIELKNITEFCLHKHRICIKGNRLFRGYTTEQFLSSCLLAKSSGAVNFRFLVQYPLENSRRETCALLWLFNSDAAVVTNVELGDHTDVIMPKPCTVCEKAQYLRVLRILYKCSPKDQGADWIDEVDAWKENPSVQPLVFTQETCFQLILLLMKSTNLVPPSVRDINGFKVGFLRTLRDCS